MRGFGSIRLLSEKRTYFEAACTHWLCYKNIQWNPLKMDTRSQRVHNKGCQIPLPRPILRPNPDPASHFLRDFLLDY